MQVQRDSVWPQWRAPCAQDGGWDAVKDEWDCIILGPRSRPASNTISHLKYRSKFASRRPREESTRRNSEKSRGLAVQPRQSSILSKSRTTRKNEHVAKRQQPSLMAAAHRRKPSIQPRSM